MSEPDLYGYDLEPHLIPVSKSYYRAYLIACYEDHRDMFRAVKDLFNAGYRGQDLRLSHK